MSLYTIKYITPLAVSNDATYHLGNVIDEQIPIEAQIDLIGKDKIVSAKSAPDALSNFLFGTEHGTVDTRFTPALTMTLDNGGGRSIPFMMNTFYAAAISSSRSKYLVIFRFVPHLSFKQSMQVFAIEDYGNIPYGAQTIHMMNPRAETPVERFTKLRAANRQQMEQAISYITTDTVDMRAAQFASIVKIQHKDWLIGERFVQVAEV